jgi:glycosyltransferase involved in cell wall biosynthesis
MKKLIMVEPGIRHPVYRETYKILNEIYDLTIATYDDFKIEGIKTKILENKKIISNSFRHYKGLYKYLVEANPDIVSVRPYYRMYSIVALEYAIKHNKKFIIMEEQRNDPENKLLDKLFFKVFLNLYKGKINKHAHKIICITEPCLGYMSKKGFKNLEYIPVPFTTRVDKPKDHQGVKMICVARFEKLKDHETLLRAIGWLKKRSLTKDMKLDLLGKGSLENKLRALCKELDIEDIVNFVGHIPNEKIDEYYQDHNLFVLTSVNDPVGVVVFEAMANGLPCIVSDNTGARGSITPGSNGFIFTTGDYKSLASAIKTYESSLFDMGNHSLEILNEEQSTEVIKKRYKDAID